MMNSDERRLLTDFLDQLKQVRGVAKDPDAAALIAAAAAEQPDAVYLLVQKALLQEQALATAKTRIAELQDQLDQARARNAAPRGGGFLSNDPWASTRPAPAPSTPWPAAPSQSGLGGPGSFLGTAAATAAGIAGGAFLFHGLQSLLGHHGSGGGFFDTAGMTPDRAENATINEYYGTDDHPPDSAFLNTDLDIPDDGFDTHDDAGDGDLSV